MAQRSVHNTHRWSRDNECKGCQCSIQSLEAQQPCKKPYKPGPKMGTKEWRKL